MKYPQATFASKVEKNQDNSLNVTREIDGGLETIKVKIPCVITTDLRLNEPRYASLPNIMKAKQKIDSIEISEFSIDLKKELKYLEVNDPPERKPGIVVPDVDSLVDKLKNEVKNNMKSLIIVEHNNNSIKQSTLNNNCCLKN